FAIPLAIIPVDYFNFDGTGILYYKTYYMTGGTFDLKKTKVTDYFDSGSEIVNETNYNYNYDDHYSVSTITQTTSDNGALLETLYQYPNELTTEPHALDLINKNMVDTPLIIQSSKNNTKTSEVKTIYEN